MVQVLRLLRRLPVANKIEDIAIFINRELLPFLQELRESTAATFEQITTDRLLGRDTAGTGDVEEISLDDTLEFTGSGSIQRAGITGDVTISAGSNVSDITAGVIVNADVNSSADIAQTKLGATTGFSVKASGASATTSDEPIVTYSASANMSSERVLSAGTNTTINTSVANEIRVDVAASDALIPDGDKGDITVSGTGTVWTVDAAAITASKLASDVTLAEVLSRGDETGANDIHVSTGQQLIFDVGGDALGDIQSLGTLQVRTASTVDMRAATGNFGLTASAGNFNMSGTSQLNFTASAASGFVRFITNGAARFWVTGTGAFAIGAGADRGTLGELFISQGDTTPIWGQAVTASYTDASVTLPKLATQAAGTLLANVTAGIASPTAHALSTLAGSGLTYTNVTGVMDVDDVPITALADQADDTFLANISGGAAPPTAVALSTLAGDGLTGGADAILAVGAGTGITVNANDVAVNQAADFDWTGKHDFEETVHLAGVFSTTLAATTSDLAIGAVNTVRITLTGAQSLTGMVPVADGQLVFLSNVDSTDALTLVHESTSSAANRFDLPSDRDLDVLIGGGVLLRYDGTSSRWRLAIPQGDGISVQHSPSVRNGTRNLEFTEGSGIDVTMSGTLPSTTIDIKIDLAEDLAWTGDYTHAGTNTYSGTETFNGTAIFNGLISGAEAVSLSAAFDKVIAATENDMAIGSVSLVTMRSVGAATLTGMVADVADQLVLLYNRDPSDTISISHQSASSSAANRFNCPSGATYNLPPNSGVLALHSVAFSGWLLFSN